MKRISFLLSDADLRKLDARAAREGKSRGELLQQSVSTSLRGSPAPVLTPRELRGHGASGVFSLRVGSQERDAILATAAAANARPASWLKQVIRAALPSDANARPTPLRVRGSSRKITLRLPEALAAQVRIQAAGESRSAPSWIAALVGARLGASLPFNGDELKALRAAVEEVARVGRNLNTLLHLWQRTGKGGASRVPVTELHAAVRVVMHQVIAVRERALHRYGENDADREGV